MAQYLKEVHRERINLGWIFLGLRILFGFVFMASGILKMWDVYSFLEVVKSYSFIPKVLVMPASILIPFAEFALGGMLVVNYRAGLARVLLITLTVLFMAMSALKYVRGEKTDCGCFGHVVERKTDVKLLVENAVIIAALIAIKPTTKKSKA